MLGDQMEARLREEFKNQVKLLEDSLRQNISSGDTMVQDSLNAINGSLSGRISDAEGKLDNMPNGVCDNIFKAKRTLYTFDAIHRFRERKLLRVGWRQ